MSSNAPPPAGLGECPAVALTPSAPAAPGTPPDEDAPVSYATCEHCGTPITGQAIWTEDDCTLCEPCADALAAEQR